MSKPKFLGIPEGGKRAGWIEMEGGGSAGGGGGVFVTVTGESDSLTSDKTFAEIAEAVKAKRDVTLCWAQESGVYSYYNLAQYMDGQGVGFSSAVAVENKVSVETVMVFPDNSIVYNVAYLSAI